MMTTNTVDAARVELLLHELRLPSIRLMWAKLAEQSDKEGWPAARFLAVLAEHEMADLKERPKPPSFRRLSSQSARSAHPPAHRR
jgi:hypothetical protein